MGIMATKYRNKKTVFDGKSFDSIKERDYYIKLKLRHKYGEITDLKCQSKFELIPKQDGERSVSYVADFDYFDNKLGSRVVVDVKSKMTKQLPAYIIKRKLMLFIHKIKLVEV